MTSPRSTAHRRLLILAAVIGGACLTVFGALFGVRFSDNFDVVEAGVAYRSGQLWPDALAAVIRQNGIRTILSLSPPEPNEVWYQGELAATEFWHLVRYELPLSSQKELSAAELRCLLALLEDAPKPLLIHSKSGADSTGLAAAIFSYAVALRPADVAKRQLSIRYGHFPFLVSGTGAMDTTFQKFLREQQNARADMDS